MKFSCRAEEIFQSMRNAFGSHACHLLVINSKPKKGPGSHADIGLPAPDPWLRFLPRKSNKVGLSFCIPLPVII